MSDLTPQQRLQVIRMDNTLHVQLHPELGPVCDHCKLPLALHGDTFAGQLCDLDLAFQDALRSLTPVERAVYRGVVRARRFRRVLREEWDAWRYRWGRAGR